MAQRSSRSTDGAALVRPKYWEIIADNVKASGWSWGCVSAIDSEGRTIRIADADRDGKRFVVRTDEELTAFLELEGSHTRTIPLLKTQEGRLA